VASEPEEQVGNPTDKYRRLPDRIPLEDTVEVQDVDSPTDPTMGRDTQRDFIVRNAGG
jgi:hypothetical protein